jgi:hypothetical protein
MSAMFVIRLQLLIEVEHFGIRTRRRGLERVIIAPRDGRRLRCNCWARGSEPVPALDWKRHGVKITLVGVEVLEVDE